MLPIPAIIGLLAQVAPSVVSAFAGDKSGKAVEKALSIAEEITGQPGDKALKAIEADPALALQYKTAVIDYEKHILQLEADDRKNARENTLSNQDAFVRRFTCWLGAACLAVGITYVFCITFLPIPDGNLRFADTILGVVISSLFCGVTGFFFGSSMGSKEKDGK